MNDLVEKLRDMAEDWRKLSDPENEVIANTAAELIEEMREALQSACEELYQISHSGGDPNDENNMDSYAAAYRECRSALSKSNPNTPERNDE